MSSQSLSRTTILILSFLSLFFGCSKDDPEVPQLAEDLHLNAIYVDGKPYREINYNADKKIESIIEYDNGELSGSSLYEYNEAGELTTLWRTGPDGEFEVAYAYEYSGGKLVKRLVYKDLFGEPSYGYTYEYNNDGRLSKEYHFSPSHPEKIQVYVRHEYDSHGNETVQRNYHVGSDTPDVLYYEEYLVYDDPQRTAAIREKIGGRLSEMMFLYSSSKVTNYENDGSEDIDLAYSYEVGIEYDPHGWPIQSSITAVQTHPQYNEDAAVVTYDYIQL